MYCHETNKFIEWVDFCNLVMSKFSATPARYDAWYSNSLHGKASCLSREKSLHGVRMWLHSHLFFRRWEGWKKIVRITVLPSNRRDIWCHRLEINHYQIMILLERWKLMLGCNWGYIGSTAVYWLVSSGYSGRSKGMCWESWWIARRQVWRYYYMWLLQRYWENKTHQSYSSPLLNAKVSYIIQIYPSSSNFAFHYPI